MQVYHVWGVGGPGDDFTSQNRGISTRSASPETLARVRDPSLDYIHTGVPSERRAESPLFTMTAEEAQAHDEYQAELVRRLELGLPSPEYVPKFGDNGTETWPDDMRIYTRPTSGKFKYWGVREDDETMEEFWARQDPEGTRLQEPADVVEPRDSSDHIEHAPEATPPRGSKGGPSRVPRGPAKRRQSKRTPEVNNTRRVRKPPAAPSSVNKNTRKSFGSKKDIDHQERSNQTQKDTAAASSGDRHTRRQDVENAPERQKAPISQKGNIKAKASPPTPARRSRATAHTLHVTPKTSQPKGPREATQVVEYTAPPKSRQGQRSAKGKPTSRKQTGKKQKTPVIRGNANVTKPEKVTKPSVAPSIHTMRTRARGPAEKIQIT